MEDLARNMLKNLSSGEAALRHALHCGETEHLPFPTSLRKWGERAVLAAVHTPQGVRILVVALRPRFLIDGFVGEKRDLPGGGAMLVGEATENAAALVRHWPWCGAAVPAGKEFLRRYAPGEVSPVDFWERDDRWRYAVFSSASGAAEVPELLKSGVTIVRRTIGAQVPVAPERKKALINAYDRRCFLLGAPGCVEFGAGEAAEIIRRFAGELESVAEMAQALDGRARLELSGVDSAAAHLLLARELVIRHVEADFVRESGTELDREIARRIGGHRVIEK